jgi:type II secretory pathway pseudopilin PulG
MAVLLVALSVTAIMLTVVMPVWKQMAQREKEEELIFRGQQYVRALRLFSMKYANASPPNIDVLVEQRFIRKKYKDPITNDDFQPILAGQNLPGAGGAQPGRGQSPSAPGGSRGGPAAPSAPAAADGRSPGAATAPGAGPAGQASGGINVRGISSIGTPGAGATGGIVGVVSKSKDKSIRLFNGRNHYNEWAFINTPQTQTPGAGAAGGPAGPGRGQRGGPGQRGTNPFGGQSPFGGPERGGRGPGRGATDGRGFGPGTSPFGSPQPVTPRGR